MKYLPYIFILLISAIALKALFASQYLPLMHDQVQAERVYEMARSLSYGQFPVRYVEDLGYGFGYPLFNFYAPLPYFLGALLYLLGANLILATKLMIAIPFVASGVAMYQLAKRYYGKAGGLLSSTLYILAPYHGVQLYVRGSIGELYTYALLPLICLGLAELWQQKIHKKKVMVGLASFMLLCIAHTVGLYITLLFVTGYFIASVIWLGTKNKSFLFVWIKRNILFFLVGLMLTAFFVFPAFFEIKYTNFSLVSGNDVNFRDHFVAISQLWNSPWGFGGSTPGTSADGMSFMIGKVTLLLALLVVGRVIFSFSRTDTFVSSILKELIVFAIIGLVSIFFMTGLSRPLWEIIPFMSIIQFPWRLLLISNLSLCFIAGAFMPFIRTYIQRATSWRYISASVIILVAIYLLFPLNAAAQLKTKYFESNGMYQKDEEMLKSQIHLRFEASKISDEYLPKTDFKPKSREDVSMDTVSCLALCRVKDVQITTSQYKFTVGIEKTAPVFIDKLNFPHFTVAVDGKPAETLSGPHDMLGVTVPQGRHTVEFNLHDTALRSFANTESLLAFVGIILYPFRSSLKAFIWNKKQKQK